MVTSTEITNTMESPREEVANAVISPAPRDVWHELFATDPMAVPYQSPAWFDCICMEGGYKDASRLYEFSSGERLLLPLVSKRGLPDQLSTAASLPNSWGMGGVLASHAIKPEGLETILADLAQLGYLHVSVRPNPLHGELWEAACPARAMAVPRLAHVLDLAGGFDEVWKHRFSKSTRNQVRRAERAGVDIESDTTGRLVPVFYELYEKSVARWANQQNEPIWMARWRAQRRDSIQKLLTIARMLGDACRVWVAWHNGKPVAASIVLQYHNTNYSRGAMDRDLAAVTNANDLLQKATIEDACRSGCRYYHLGESGTSKSLAYFKSRFGAVAYSYAEYHLERVPLTKWDGMIRTGIKRLIGFKDA